MAGLFLITLGMMVFGEACRNGSLTLGRYTRWPGDSVSFGYFCLAVSVWFACAALMQLIQPARLILSPTELVYIGPWWKRRWAWRDLGEFVIERENRAREIRFVAPARGPGLRWTVSADPRERIPGLWEINLVQVRDRLNEARGRWG
jgi:hypothetical protein